MAFKTITIAPDQMVNARKGTKNLLKAELMTTLEGVSVGGGVELNQEGLGEIFTRQSKDTVEATKSNIRQLFQKVNNNIKERGGQPRQFSFIIEGEGDKMTVKLYRREDKVVKGATEAPKASSKSKGNKAAA